MCTIRRIVSVALLAAFLLPVSGLQAAPQMLDLRQFDRQCGPRINTGDVLVVDLEPFDLRAASTANHLAGSAGDFRLLSEELVVIRSILTFGSLRRSKGVQRAKDAAARRGCDLVVLLQSGVYGVRDNFIYGPQNGITSIQHIAYAVVWMGQRH